MKKYYYLAIPVIVTIILAYYLLVPNTTNSDKKITTQSLIQNGSPLMGNPTAPITIVEWGDYQCTYCYRFHQSSKDVLIQEYVNTGKINFVFRDFPLNGPDSVLAAQASYCADDQSKYWEYHDEIYKNWAGERTGWVTRTSLDQFANTIGLDLVQFTKCLNDKKYQQRVLENEKFGTSIGIKATPSFLIFNTEKITKIEGNQPFSVFRQVLDTI
ncbi:MAG: thioredoxin domain-containing protein [Nitrosopumilaceae archaeon]